MQDFGTNQDRVLAALIASSCASTAARYTRELSRLRRNPLIRQDRGDARGGEYHRVPCADIFSYLDLPLKAFANLINVPPPLEVEDNRGSSQQDGEVRRSPPSGSWHDFGTTCTDFTLPLPRGDDPTRI